MSTIAFLDWGIGGFSVVRAWQQRYPGAGYTYISDSGFTPYGRTSNGVLVKRLELLSGWLAGQGIEQLVIACNAASTVIDKVGWPKQLRVVGMLDAGIQTVEQSHVRCVGIVGGRRTIYSGVLRQALQQRGIEVQQRVAQPLSALVERGCLDGDEVIDLLQKIVAPLRSCPALLLACTHYPALGEVWKRALPGVQLLDPAITVALQLPSGIGPTQVWTSGDPKELKRAAQAAFGIKIDNPMIVRFGA